MFFPGKEEFIAFEQLEKRQYQIYTDACDVGIITIVKKPNYPSLIKNRLFTLNESELSDYRIKLKRLMNAWEYDTEKWSNGKSITIHVTYEMDEPGVYLGSNLKVTFHFPKEVEFIEIQTERAVFNHNTLKGGN